MSRDRSAQPAVVAELGRPETPEETAARKAQDSRNHRTRQTVNNLVLSLLATLAIVVVIVLIVPRGEPVAAPAVDYATIAGLAQGTEADPLVTPKLPEKWVSNSAVLHTKTADGIDDWYIGLISPAKQFVGVTQGFNANSSWLADQVNRSLASGTTVIDGVQWTIYDNRQASTDQGNVKYALTTEFAHSTFVVFGTANPQEIDTVAGAVTAQLRTMNSSNTNGESSK
ncbi:DUF4245 family protein [Leifsonia sp. Root112D2]|jgi:hypothetical protein|uniref:DUF4245 family protein n=1 Tax=Leifsonia sp. Root112D2 TaxID=1736426 RepID=UPI0006F6726E|nr:DUF4245 family protein [Leifsonia sp. Root112D2]KQV07510.1 hypothetical protein ASC63_09625 [Leifsonia sp. Root112D2]